MREIKFEILFEVYNKDFTKKVLKHYTSINRLINGDDDFDYSSVNIIAKRQFTGLQDKNGVDIYEYMEIDGLYNVEFRDGSYVLIDISNSDILLLYNYINSRGGNVKITREYTKI